MDSLLVLPLLDLIGLLSSAFAIRLSHEQAAQRELPVFTLWFSLLLFVFFIGRLGFDLVTSVAGAA
jgi:hypothetical protein